jgi:hypothetical protein
MVTSHATTYAVNGSVAVGNLGVDKMLSERGNNVREEDIKC